MYFLASQSVNDLRYDNSNGSVMTWITSLGPAQTVSGLVSQFTAITWS